jgi:hypothetical protein
MPRSRSERNYDALRRGGEPAWCESLCFLSFLAVFLALLAVLLVLVQPRLPLLVLALRVLQRVSQEPGIDVPGVGSPASPSAYRRMRGA